MTTLLRPVERQTLAKVVMQQLLAYIRGGELRPGDALPSQHVLAERLSVSRPVLREAMQGLAAVGAIDIRPGSGCYVLEPAPNVDPDALFEIVSHEMAVELLEARMVVEVELAALAAERATAGDLSGMETILARLKRASARGQVTTQITLDFHLAVNRAGHNGVLYRMAQVMTRARVAQGLRIEHAFPDIAAGEYESHRLLAAAVRSGDPATARAAMRRHLDLAHGWEEQTAALQRTIDGRRQTTDGRRQTTDDRRQTTDDGRRRGEER